VSIRLIKGSIGAICAVGLAIAGIGWHSEDKPRVAAPKTVYCNVDRLLRYHPAWNQYVQLRGLPPRESSVGDSVSIDTPVDNAVSTRTESAQVVARDQSGLRAELEAKSQKELSQIGGKLRSALQARCDERRNELCADAKVKAENAKRQSDAAVAGALRAYDEQHQYDRLAAEMKLSALKAQASGFATSSARTKTALASAQAALDALRADRDRTEAQLRAQARESDLNVKAACQVEIDCQVAAVKNAELQRIDARIATAKSRVQQDLDGDMMSGEESRLASRPQTIGAGFGAGAKAGKVVAQAKSQYVTAVKCIAGSQDIQSGLRQRMRAEIAAAVNRIARENGLRVTFVPENGAKDSTYWFKQRLPFASAPGLG
jgi:hypothetical protein